MKLLNDLYKIQEIGTSETTLEVSIVLNPEHLVYSGHFPGHPVTPGVVQLQIVHELLERHFGKNLVLVEMPVCKFLAVIDPTVTPKVVVQITFEWLGDLLKVQARGQNDSVLFFKFSARYRFGAVEKK